MDGGDGIYGFDGTDGIYRSTLLGVAHLTVTRLLSSSTEMPFNIKRLPVIRHLFQSPGIVRQHGMAFSADRTAISFTIIARIGASVIASRLIAQEDRHVYGLERG